jgi:hypothetical protein
MLVRWTIRLLSSLIGIAAGLIISDATLSNFHISVEGVVVATLVFWVVHIVVSFLALRVLIRQPSIAMAGLLAVASTIISLVIVSFIVSSMKVTGFSTYVLATLIIWATTAIGDIVGQRMIRARRIDRRNDRRS